MDMAPALKGKAVMRVMLCASIEAAERVVSTALVLLRWQEPPTLILVHVRDTGLQHGLEQARSWFTGRSGLGAMHAARAVLTERSVAEDMLNEARELCIAAGHSPDLITTSLLEGRPEQEIVRMAQEVHAHLIVLGNHDRPVDPHGKPRPKRGPGSIGHVARFVVDHAPCPVLVLRL
jgi:nucleotide-binding universal stress UspA family protein